MRSHRLWRALSERRGEGYVDVIVLVLCAVMVLALAMRVLPVQRQAAVPLCCQKKQGFIRTFYGPVMEESS